MSGQTGPKVNFDII
jgi:hypothetical protein